MFLLTSHSTVHYDVYYLYKLLFSTSTCRVYKYIIYGGDGVR